MTFRFPLCPGSRWREWIRNYVAGGVVAALALGGTLRAQEPASATGAVVPWVGPETLLASPADNPAWRDLFQQLAPNKTRQSTFEEKRFFPFRKAPVILKGEIRIVPEQGLSLRYLEPEPRVMIVDAKGLLVRDNDGRERPAPSDSRAQMATSAMVNVLRFDLAALSREFSVYGRREGAAWTLAFVPRDPNFANLLGTLTVGGEGGAVSRIAMIKSANQRIEITLRDTMEDVLFTADTLRRFFR